MLSFLPQDQGSQAGPGTEGHMGGPPTSACVTFSLALTAPDSPVEAELTPNQHSHSCPGELTGCLCRHGQVSREAARMGRDPIPVWLQNLTGGTFWFRVHCSSSEELTAPYHGREPSPTHMSTLYSSVANTRFSYDCQHRKTRKGIHTK